MSEASSSSSSSATSALETASRIAGRTLEGSARAALFAMMALGFADVILRSVLNAPIEAATETIRILMAAMVFLHLPLTCARGTHISVDLLDGAFRGRRGVLRDALVDALCGLALLEPIRRVIVISERAREHGDVTEYLGIPQYLVISFIALLSAISAATLLGRSALGFLRLRRADG